MTWRPSMCVEALVWEEYDLIHNNMGRSESELNEMLLEMYTETP